MVEFTNESMFNQELAPISAKTIKDFVKIGDSA